MSRLATDLKTLLRRGRDLMERAYYTGDAVACNVCDHTARAWSKRRVYGRCPSCRCASRARILWWYVQDAFAQPGDLRVLHFAPEPPLEARLRAWGASSYQTCDLRGSHVDINANLEALPFSDGSYDLVICSHVLEHVPDHQRAMRELRRICSPRGRVLVMVPLRRSGSTEEDLSDLSPAERKRRFGEIDHLREYGLDIREFLSAASFQVDTWSPSTQVSISSRSRHGIDPDQPLFVCAPRS